MNTYVQIFWIYSDISSCGPSLSINSIKHYHHQHDAIAFSSSAGAVDRREFNNRSGYQNVLSHPFLSIFTMGYPPSLTNGPLQSCRPPCEDVVWSLTWPGKCRQMAHQQDLKGGHFQRGGPFRKVRNHCDFFVQNDQQRFSKIANIPS